MGAVGEFEKILSMVFSGVAGLSVLVVFSFILGFLVGRLQRLLKGNKSE
jgi:hypothetical protein